MKEGMYDVEQLYDATYTCLLYTSDAADERSSVDLGGRRIIKKKKHTESRAHSDTHTALLMRTT